MRAFLLWVMGLLILTLGGLFVVGEFFGGVFLGRPPQTPMFVYKRDLVVRLARVDTTADGFDFSVRGKVRQGQVAVRGYYEDPTDLWTGADGAEEKRIFMADFTAGQRVDVSHEMTMGPGIYRVKIYMYDDPVGLFWVTLPPDEALLQ